MSVKPSSAERAQHFAVLDGMRGIGALVIVAGHTMMTLDLYHYIPHAQTGVDLFFALSGFVICTAYYERMQKGMTVGDFTLRRLVRLYPMIPISVLLGAVVCVIRFLVQHRTDMFGDVLGSSLLHLVFLPSPLLAIETDGDAWAIDTPLWSLTAEMIANLAFGFGLWKLGARALGWVAVIGAAAFGWFALQLNDTNVGGEWQNLHVGLARVVFPFCAGMILWHVTRNHRPRANIPAFWVLGLMLAVILAPNMGRFNVAYGLLSIWIAMPALLYLGAFHSTLSNRFLLLLGELSYPIYVLHFPLIRMVIFGAKKLGITETAPWTLVAICIVVSTLVGYLAYRFYDEPLRRWLTAQMKKKQAQRSTRPSSAPVLE